MANRLDLQTALETLLGLPNVYFDPPESIKLKYPAIVYNLNTYTISSANNSNYIAHPGYQLILMDTDPDSNYVEKILSLSYCSFVRHYTAGGLHHWVFNLYQE